MENKFTTVEFLFNKLTYKSSSYASAHCINPSLLMSAWLTTIVFSVSALFCRKISEKVYLSLKTVNYQKKGRAWRWTFLRVSKQVKACGFNWRVFHHANFSNLANVFASVIVFPLKHIIRVSFAFWHQKWQNYCDESLFLFWWHMGHVNLAMTAYLFKVHVEFFGQKDSIDKTWFFINIFYYTINRKRPDMHILPKTASTSNRCPLKVTSTTFLFTKKAISALSVVT